MKRNRMVVNLVENSSIEGIKNEEKLLTIYFFVCEIPVWILFYALGATSGKEIVDLINYWEGDGRIHNIIFVSIREADDKCDTFRRGKNAVLFLEERVKGVQFLPSESIDACLNLYVFPNIKGLKRKARTWHTWWRFSYWLILDAKKRITGMTFEIRGLKSQYGSVGLASDKPIKIRVSGIHQNWEKSLEYY